MSDYRIVRRQFPDGEAYAIYVVHYHKSGKPMMRSIESVSPQGFSLEEFDKSFTNYLEATKKPILDYDTLEEIKCKKPLISSTVIQKFWTRLEKFWTHFPKESH